MSWLQTVEMIRILKNNSWSKIQLAICWSGSSHLHLRRQKSNSNYNVTQFIDLLFCVCHSYHTLSENWLSAIVWECRIKSLCPLLRYPPEFTPPQLSVLHISNYLITCFISGQRRLHQITFSTYCARPSVVKPQCCLMLNTSLWVKYGPSFAASRILNICSATVVYQRPMKVYN